MEKHKKPKSNLAVTGVYGFNPTFFKVYEAGAILTNEMEITDAISLLIDAGFKVVPHNVEAWWKDTGQPEAILEANCQRRGGMFHLSHASNGSLSV